jgi:hypothetical protein
MIFYLSQTPRTGTTLPDEPQIATSIGLIAPVASVQRRSITLRYEVQETAAIAV